MKKIFSLVLAVSLVCITALSSFAGQKKALFIIAAQDFQDQEFSRPFSALSQEGVAVTVASTVEGEATGMNGAKARVDIQLKDAKVDDYDAIVFIGGSGTTQYVDDPLAHSIAQDAVKKKKLLAAICMGPLVLANAGVLKGKKATVFPSLAEPFRQKGAKYTGASVERDGRIITADGPDSASAFGEEINKAL
jgi:protease I